MGAGCVHIKCSDRALRDLRHGGRVGLGSPNIRVLVAKGNKFGTWVATPDSQQYGKP